LAVPDDRRRNGVSPLVSVILPTHNASSFVSRAIDSALDQQGGHALELIIVDDCSADGTMEFIRHRYGHDERVILVTTGDNGGPGVARNEGIARASGEWIGLIDADDSWAPDRLSALAPLCAPDVDAVFDNIIGYDQAAEVCTGLLFPALPQPMTIPAMAAEAAPGSKFNFGYLKPLVRRDFLLRTSVRYPEVRISEDLLFYLELLINGARTRTTNEGFYVYTTGVGQISRRSSTISASIPDDALVGKLLDELAARYRNRLADKDLLAIESRADRLRRMAPLNRLHHNWTRRRYAAVARQCLTDRAARHQLIRAVAKRLLRT
jgi:succinoglycan biosynthesis protein ExoO